MRKKIIFNLILFATLFILTNETVFAKITCKYTDFSLTATFDIENAKSITSATISGNLNSKDETNIKNEKNGIENWNSNFSPLFSGIEIKFKGQDYYEKHNTCPPYLIVVDRVGQFDVAVIDESHKIEFKKYAEKKQGYDILSLIDPNLLDKPYVINFVANSESTPPLSKLEGTMDSINAKYGTPVSLPEAGYKIVGFSIVGWNVQSKNKWLCSDGTYDDDNSNCLRYYCSNDTYGKTCSSYKYENGEKKYGYLKYVYRNGQKNVNIKTNNDANANLYAIWSAEEKINASLINYYKLGKDVCISKKYVWNDEYNFCNTDNLLFISCGNGKNYAGDLPYQVPKLISFFFNLLKIAAPIVLVIISIISLVKAITASKEDEMKKAQNSLVKKIIIAVLIFFISSIVQFVISLVAENSLESGSISNCLDCLLNNKCENSAYFKTNIGGRYYCTYLNDSSIGEIEECK